jgi:hypothetical protein
VTVIIRNEHGAVGRYRQLMMVSNDREALENLPEEWKRRVSVNCWGFRRKTFGLVKAIRRKDSARLSLPSKPKINRLN